MAALVDNDVDPFEQMEQEQWELLAKSGYTEEQITALKNQKRWKEDVWMYSYMIKIAAWESDVTCTLTDCFLKLSVAQDGLCRRQEAIKTLEGGLIMSKDNVQIELALAKLLFRDDQKQAASDMCSAIIEQHRRQQETDCTAADADPCTSVSTDDISGAYYLGGWVKIHDDDHTGAYGIWQRGHRAVPSCPVLKRQFDKRACWDCDEEPVEEEVVVLSRLVGSAAAAAAGTFRLSELDSFSAVHLFERTEDPHDFATSALALFDKGTQQDRVVFRSPQPVLTADECRRVMGIVDAHHSEKLGGQWGSVRSSSVHTTDVAVEDISILRPWLRQLLRSALFPMLAAAFPKLADGSSTMDPTTGSSRMRVHDAFIVRYDAEAEAQSLSLPEHRDTSSMSMVVALNSESEGEYSGGGTWFEALDKSEAVINAPMGHAVAFAGPLKHAGFPITRGTRNILVLFLYVEDFHYGPFLAAANAFNTVHDRCCGAPSESQSVDTTPGTVTAARATGVTGNGTATATATATASDGPRVKESGDSEGGYVVYRQTVELVNLLMEGTAEDRDEE